jgi:hypothetical protein
MLANATITHDIAGTGAPADTMSRLFANSSHPEYRAWDWAVAHLKAAFALAGQRLRQLPV